MKDVQIVYDTCVRKLDNLGIKTGVIKEFKVNKRAKRWGRCKKIPNPYHDDIFEIEINANLLSDDIDDKATETTMIHELLHTCKGCMNHGPEWKRLALRVNAAYGYNVTRLTSPEEKGIEVDATKMKYKITCEKCGKSFYRQRSSNLIKHPERYFHTGCNGKLRVEVQN